MKKRPPQTLRLRLGALLACALFPVLSKAQAHETVQAERPADLGWTGFTLGGHLGYALGRASTTLSDPEARTWKSTFGVGIGGLQAGYGHMLDRRLFLGIEADVSFPNFMEGDDRVSSAETSLGRLKETLDWFGSLRVRAGWTLARGLIYGTGGFAWSVGHFALNATEEKQWGVRPGWTVGAGFELPVSSHWRARVDYTYAQFDRAQADFLPALGTDSTVGIHSVNFGLSWAIPWSRKPVAILAPESPLADEPVAQRPGPPESALNPSASPAERWNLHGQSTFVGQGYPGFRSPYQGAQSLSGNSQFKNTTSATAFLGVRLWQGAELYLNPELMQGFGLSDTHGVAGFPNGEAQRSNFPVPRFNAARMYFSQSIGFGDEEELVEDGPNQLAGKRKVERLSITVGKFSVTDFFLLNTFAGEPRTRFLNWNIYGTGAYDWTMDLLSWTWGGFVELDRKHWSLRTGYFLLPSVANTNHFDTRIPSKGQYLVEGEGRYALFGKPGKVQLFGWLSFGNIGSYDEALTQPGVPDVKLTRGVDRTNGGLVLALEQTIDDNLGFFSRASWSPEKGESMGWTDCGRAFVLGGTLKGTRWHRPEDIVGLAAVVEGLSPVARRYFAAGGMGTIIGDGALNYQPEMVAESFYAYSPFPWATATLDYQLLIHPGYNADRGPVSIFALRLHAAF